MARARSKSQDNLGTAVDQQAAAAGRRRPNPSPGRSLPADTPANIASQTAAAEAGAAYSPLPNIGALAPTPPTTQRPTSTNALTTAENGQLQSASAQISSFLSQVPGLATLDPTGQLAAWMNGQASTLAGQGMDSATIVNTIETTMNNPSNDPGALAVFNSLFPGYNQKIANGTSDSNGSYTGIAGYIQYANAIQSYASSAGLVPGTISATDIGNLWAGDVSASEVSTRLTTDYANAAQAWKNIPGFADHMQQYYGMNLNQLVSYYINPTNTLNQINQQISAVQAGTAAANTGFGEISAAQAGALSAFLTNSGATQLTSSDAVSQFESNLGDNGLGGSLGSAAALAHGGFETARPGQSSTGVVSPDQLLGAIEGNAADLAATASAQQARTAGSRGGGGATTTAKGAVGLGYAES